jgi:hypothetical protein
VGHVKDDAYKTRVEDVATLHARVLKLIQSMTKQTMTCAGVEQYHSLDIIRTTRGSHAQIYYSTHTLFELNNLQKTHTFCQIWL